ncbi:MAG: hypothetical protein ACI4IS_07890 [Acutalibacteraceae bacterium]
MNLFVKILRKIKLTAISIRNRYNNWKKSDKRQLRKFRLRHFIHNRRNNPNDTYYIIWWSQSSSGCGLFVHIIYVLSQIDYAVKHGFIPVVDMRGVPNSYTNNKNVNAWELFFEQPVAGVTPEEVYRCKNVVFSNGRPIDSWISPLEFDKNWNNFFNNSSAILEYRDFLSKYFRLNEEISCELDKKYREIFEQSGVDGKETLGVLLRGTDYLLKKPYFRPVQPDVDMITDKLFNVLQELKYSQIFLSTEDERIFSIISEWAKENGITVLDNPSNIRFTYDEKTGSFLNEFMKTNGIDFCEKQKNYLINMLLLTRCDALVSGKTSASRFLPLLNDYKYQYFFELGQYS